MLVLALMAVGTLPLIMGAVRTSTGNRSLVAATTFANAQLAALRAEFGNGRTDATCIELKQWLITTNTAPNNHDPAGTRLDSTLRVDPLDPSDPRYRANDALASFSTACPTGAAGPIVVTVAAQVYPSGTPGRNLASLSTQILVATP